jgi:hypothetical protein
LQEEKDKFFEANGFFEVPGASRLHQDIINPLKLILIQFTYNLIKYRAKTWFYRNDSCFGSDGQGKIFYK